MNLRLLVNELEVIASAPNGVNLLRSLILDMALSGQLSAGTIHFEPRLLGDITSIRTGKLDANASSEDGKYPFFTCAKDPLRISSFSYDTECVLLAGNGNFDVNYYSGKFDAYQRTYILEPRDRDELYVPFLYRFMQSHARRLTEQSIGGVIKYLKIGFLTSAPILVPSLTDQRGIVEIIDSMMEMCDQIELKIKVRDSVRTSVRKSSIDAISTAQSPEELQLAWERIQSNWEVFAGSRESIESLRNLILTLAISGNLTKDFSPEDTVEELLDKVSKTLNPYPEISDERFAIPSNWKWVSLASVAEHQLGKMLHTAKMKGVRRLYLRSVNVRPDGTIDLTDLNEMLIPEIELEKYNVKNGDLFVNEGGDVGRNAIFDLKIDFELAYQNQLHRLRPVCGIEGRYIQFVLRQAKSQGVISQMSSGVTIQHFSASALRRFAIPLPPLSEQKLIVEKVNHLMKFCDDLERKVLEVTHLSEKFVRSVVSA